MRARAEISRRAVKARCVLEGAVAEYSRAVEDLTAWCQLSVEKRHDEALRSCCEWIGRRLNARHDEAIRALHRAEQRAGVFREKSYSILTRHDVLKGDLASVSLRASQRRIAARLSGLVECSSGAPLRGAEAGVLS